MSITDIKELGREDITVGRYKNKSRRIFGPNGRKWEKVWRGGKAHRVQTYSSDLFDAKIIVHGRELKCHHATMEELKLADNTLPLVPPPHLDALIKKKTDGFYFADTAGKGKSISFTGGANAIKDYRETKGFDETKGVIITHGAFWHYNNMGITPTMLHEIGHVIVGKRWLNSGKFTRSRKLLNQYRRLRRAPSPSKNGKGGKNIEVICNCYMFFLCYGAPASNQIVREFGEKGGASWEVHSRTREYLRNTKAFEILDDSWKKRYIER